MGTSERCKSVRNNTVSMFTFPWLSLLLLIQASGSLQKPQQQNCTPSPEAQSIQFCQQSSGLHRNTVTLGKLVALSMWLVPGESSVVFLEKHPSLGCHTATGCTTRGAGTLCLSLVWIPAVELFRGDREEATGTQVKWRKTTFKLVA